MPSTPVAPPAQSLLATSAALELGSHFSSLNGPEPIAWVPMVPAAICADGASSDLACRNDRRVGVVHGGEDRRVGLLELEDDGAGIGRLDGLDRQVVGAVGGTRLLVEDALERCLDVGRGQRGTVLELGLGVELEGELLAVGGKLPRRGDARNDLEVGIEAHERFVDQLKQAQRRKRGLLMRVESSGVLRPGHPQRRCIGMACDSRQADHHGRGCPKEIFELAGHFILPVTHSLARPEWPTGSHGCLLRIPDCLPQEAFRTLQR